MCENNDFKCAKLNTIVHLKSDCLVDHVVSNLVAGTQVLMDLCAILISGDQLVGNYI